MISMYSIGLILFPHDTKPNTISFRRKFYLLLQFYLVFTYQLVYSQTKFMQVEILFLESPQA